MESDTLPKFTQLVVAEPKIKRRHSGSEFGLLTTMLGHIT